jgi:hypothetical protein
MEGGEDEADQKAGGGQVGLQRQHQQQQQQHRQLPPQRRERGVAGEAGSKVSHCEASFCFLLVLLLLLFL